MTAVVSAAFTAFGSRYWMASELQALVVSYALHRRTIFRVPPVPLAPSFEAALTH
jgi:hypothetical protein